MSAETANVDAPSELVLNELPLTRTEWKLASVSASTFFLLLCSYYILRPVRDEMAVQTGANRLPWLFTGTFLCTLAVVPLFGWLAKHLSRAVLVPLVYGIMIACLTVFFTVFATGITPVWAAVFFMWLSLFNLLVVSLFWSCVSDAFTTQQARRCYGYLTAGGTAGAIAGPTITTMLAVRVGTAPLILISMVLLGGAMGGLILLRRVSFGEQRTLQRPLGGSILAGITETATSPLLRGVAGLVICYSAVSTVLYMELTGLAGKTFSNPDLRTEFFARIDLCVNLIALATQLLGTRFLVQRAGLRWTLITGPLLVVAGLLVLGAWPSLILVAVVQVIHRASEFSLSRPGREILFTTVDPEARYKAKNFIDTAVYRANDTLSAWIISTLTRMGGSAVWFIAIPVGLIWGILGRRIGRQEDLKSGRSGRDERSEKDGESR